MFAGSCRHYVHLGRLYMYHNVQLHRIITCNAKICKFHISMSWPQKQSFYSIIAIFCIFRNRKTQLMPKDGKKFKICYSVILVSRCRSFKNTFLSTNSEHFLSLIWNKLSELNCVIRNALNIKESFSFLPKINCTILNQKLRRM